jgi:hypothetical protein
MVLNRVSIAAPCPADWDQMPGSDQVRHCSQCNKNVYNLSAMTRRQAEALLRETEGRLCARLYRRADGTILTENCPIGVRAITRRISRFAGAAMSAVATLTSATAAQLPFVQISNAVQAATGTVTGVVQDARGAVIPNAAVDIVNSTGKVFSAASDEAGRFRVGPLPRGSYSVRIVSPGFLTFKKNFILSPSSYDLKAKLELGALMGEVVEVPTTWAPYNHVPYSK